MKGQFFAHLSPDPKIEKRVNIKTGIVERVIGNDHFLLRFDGAAHFANVLSADQLGAFAFFNTKEDLELFISELMAQQAQVASANESA